MNPRTHRALALLLALVLAVSLLAPGAAAAGDGQSYQFSLLADGQKDTRAQTGDTVTFQLVLTNTTAAGSYDLYTMQDYVTFDRSFFRLVDGSIRTLDGAGLSAGGMSFDGGESDRIYINRTSPTPFRVEKEAVFMTFELKVIGTAGTGSVQHDTYFVSKDMTHSASTAQAASVSIGVRQYAITAAAGAGGTISPSGQTLVNKGASQTFRIAAGSGYAIRDVKVDGASVGAVKEYTFSDVRKDHSIAAEFQSAGGTGGASGGITVPSDGENTVNFTDVKTTDWFYDSVQYCVRGGLMNGTTADRFNPKGTTTRAMIVTILWRIEGSPAASGSVFEDVPAGKWCSQAVAWAAANGIVNGYTDTIFKPNNSITRQQLAAIFYRYAAYKQLDVSAQNDLSQFTDLGSVSAWALPGLRWANQVGLVNGRTSTILAPTGTATRAECAVIIRRFCENIL